MFAAVGCKLQRTRKSEPFCSTIRRLTEASASATPITCATRRLSESSYLHSMWKKFLKSETVVNLLIFDMLHSQFHDKYIMHQLKHEKLCNLQLSLSSTAVSILQWDLTTSILMLLTSKFHPTYVPMLPENSLTPEKLCLKHDPLCIPLNSLKLMNFNKFWLTT